jgi:hypothetical protein
MRPEVGIRVAPCGGFISSSGGECNWWVVDECAKEEITNSSDQITGLWWRCDFDRAGTVSCGRKRGLNAENAEVGAQSSLRKARET